jgi:hypothetical protein
MHALAPLRAEASRLRLPRRLSLNECLARRPLCTADMQTKPETVSRRDARHYLLSAPTGRTTEVSLVDRRGPDECWAAAHSRCEEH